MSGRGAFRVLTGLADQALYSLTNFVLSLLVAGVASRAAFGVFALLAVTVVVLVAANRGLTADPVVVRYSGSTPSVWRGVVEQRFGLAVGAGTVLGALLVIAGVTVLPGSFAAMALAFGCGLPVVLAQDFLRFAAFAAARPVDAFVNDAAVAVAQLPVSVLLLVTGVRAPVAYVLVWVGASAVGAGIGARRLGVRPRPGWRRALRADADLAGRFTADNLISQLSQQGTAYVVGAAVGLAAAGALRAAQTVYMPLAVISLGIQSAVVPELVRVRQRSREALRRALAVQASVMMTLVVVYSLVVLAIPDSLGRRLLGATWEQAQPLLIVMAFGAVGASLINNAVAGVRALGDASGSLRTRMLTVLVTAVLVVPAAVISGLHAAVVALAIAAWVQGALWWTRFVRSYRTHAGEPSPQSASSPAGLSPLDTGEL